jgi:acyl-CoA hydrolase
MHISVSVHARNPRDRERRFTTHCILVFVALDDSGKPLRIRDFEPVTEHSKRLNAYAKRMIELREQLQTESQSFLITMEA